MSFKSIAKKTAGWLVVVGAINWGLVGAFGFDLVQKLFGTWPMLVTTLLVLVGVSGIYELIRMFNR